MIICLILHHESTVPEVMSLFIYSDNWQRTAANTYIWETGSREYLAIFNHFWFELHSLAPTSVKGWSGAFFCFNHYNDDIFGFWTADWTKQVTWSCWETTLKTWDKLLVPGLSLKVSVIRNLKHALIHLASLSQEFRNTWAPVLQTGALLNTNTTECDWYTHIFKSRRHAYCILTGNAASSGSCFTADCDQKEKNKKEVLFGLRKNLHPSRSDL